MLSRRVCHGFQRSRSRLGRGGDGCNRHDRRGVRPCDLWQHPPDHAQGCRAGAQRGAAGVVGSAVFVGMLLGGLSVGLLVRRLGVRNMLMLGIGCFSLAMAGAALAHQPWALGFLRLLAGWGLGAVMPACMAMTRQSATSRSGPFAISAVMAGIPLGGIAGSSFTYLGAGTLGWRGLFGVGALLGVLLLPFVSMFAERVTAHGDGAATPRQGRLAPPPFGLSLLLDAWPRSASSSPSTAL